MKRSFLTKMVSAALSTCLLTAVASAAPLAVPPNMQTRAYTVTDRISAPISVRGSIVEKSEGQIYLENSDESDPYNKIFVNISNETKILDAVTGEGRSLEDLKEGESVYAYVGPAMTRSMPPIAHADVVLCNIPSDYAVPTYAQVQQVTVGEDSGISALTDQSVIYHLNEETELVSFDTKNVVTLEDIKPGTQVLAWYSIVAMSMPAQATPTKIMIFPYEYDGYVTLGDTSIALDGEQLVAGFVEDETLLLPLRTMAEALGCELNWNGETQTVDTSKNGELIYSITVDGENATVGAYAMALRIAPKLVDGTTYVAVDDLLILHDLKLAK